MSPNFSKEKSQDSLIRFVWGYICLLFLFQPLFHFSLFFYGNMKDFIYFCWQHKQTQTQSAYAIYLSRNLGLSNMSKSGE